MPSTSGPPLSGVGARAPDLGDLAGLDQELALRGLPFRVWLRPQVASSQDLVAAAAGAGEPEGLVVVCDLQTRGRGRGGRSWTAPPGTAVMLSLLWRPTSGLARLTSLPLVVGLAVAEGIERAGGPRTALKWPNDCLIRDRKVAGVLVEASEAGGGPAVVAGVGCNLRWRGLDPAARPAGSSTALDLEGFSGTRARLAVELLASLERRYRDFERSGFEDLRQEWQRRAAWIGSEVRVDGGGGAITGVYLGVDRSGALLLQPPEGATVAVSTGDLGPGPALRPATGSGCWHRHPSTGPELG